MNELKKELNKIHLYYLQKYISVYDKSGTIQAMSSNISKFNPIFKECVDEITSKSNEYLDKNGLENKNEIEEHIKELTKQFGRSGINPF